MNEWIQRHDVIFLCEIATSVQSVQVTEISVDQCYSFPSDHAPLSIRLDTSGLNRVSPATLLTRASQLGDHAVLHPTGANPGHGHEPQLQRRRPIYPDDIDPIIFQNRLENIDLTDNFWSCFDEFPSFPGRLFVDHSPCILRRTAYSLYLKFDEETRYCTPQAWWAWLVMTNCC